MRDMLRVNHTKLSSGECSSKTLDTKPEWTLLERLVLEEQLVIWKSFERIEESCSKILSHIVIDETAFLWKYQEKLCVWQ